MLRTALWNHWFWVTLLAGGPKVTRTSTTGSLGVQSGNLLLQDNLDMVSLAVGKMDKFGFRMVQLNERSEMREEMSHMQEEMSQMQEERSQMQKEMSQMREERSQLMEERSQIRNRKGNGREQLSVRGNEKPVIFSELPHSDIDSDYNLTSEDFPLTESDYLLSDSDYPLNDGDYPLTDSDYPLTDGDYAIARSEYLLTDSDYPLTHSDYPINDSDYPLNDSDYPLTDKDHQLLQSDYPLTENEYLLTNSDYHHMYSDYHLNDYITTDGDTAIFDFAAIVATESKADQVEKDANSKKHLEEIDHIIGRDSQNTDGLISFMPDMEVVDHPEEDVEVDDQVDGDRPPMSVSKSVSKVSVKIGGISMVSPIISNTGTAGLHRQEKKISSPPNPPLSPILSKSLTPDRSPQSFLQSIVSRLSSLAKVTVGEMEVRDSKDNPMEIKDTFQGSEDSESESGYQEKVDTEYQETDSEYSELAPRFKDINFEFPEQEHSPIYQDFNVEYPEHSPGYQDTNVQYPEQSPGYHHINMQYPELGSGHQDKPNLNSEQDNTETYPELDIEMETEYPEPSPEYEAVEEDSEEDPEDSGEDSDYSAIFHFVPSGYQLIYKTGHDLDLGLHYDHDHDESEEEEVVDKVNMVIKEVLREQRMVDVSEEVIIDKSTVDILDVRNKVGIFLGVIMLLILCGVTVTVVVGRRRAKLAKLVEEEVEKEGEGVMQDRGVNTEVHLSPYMRRASLSCDELTSLEGDNFLTSLETITSSEDREEDGRWS